MNLIASYSTLGGAVIFARGVPPAYCLGPAGARLVVGDPAAHFKTSHLVRSNELNILRRRPLAHAHNLPGVNEASLETPL
jgi:hypothetical protein